jgi:hypothetical protein
MRAIERVDAVSEEQEPAGEEAQRDWHERIGLLSSAASALLKTRLAILREELAVKALFAAKALAGVAVALFAGAGALLLFAALLAAIFASLLKSVVLGILAAFVLYGLITAVAAALGWRALTRVKPFDFRATQEELRRDWDAVRIATQPTKPAPLDAAIPPIVTAPPAGSEEDADLEDRFRAGAE